MNSIGAGEADAGERASRYGLSTHSRVEMPRKLSDSSDVFKYQTREQMLKTKLQSSRTQLEQERECRQNLEKKLGISSSLSKIERLEFERNESSPNARSDNNEQGVQTNHHTNNNMHRRGSHSRSGSDLSISVKRHSAAREPTQKRQRIVLQIIRSRRNVHR